MKDPVKLFYINAAASTVVGASFVLAPQLAPIAAAFAAIAAVSIGRRVTPSLDRSTVLIATLGGMGAGYAVGSVVAYEAHQMLSGPQQSNAQENNSNKPVRIDYSGQRPVAILQSKKAALG